MAGTAPLALPPSDIHLRTLTIRQVRPEHLVRVSRYDTGEPHFGRTATQRFDDAHADVTLRFGTCYLGFRLDVAFAESVLHNLSPDALGFKVPLAEVTTRFALSFKGPKALNVAVLCGAPLLTLGGHGEISGTSDYTVPQAWASALAGHPANVDGFIYMSRRFTDQPAVVLFERMPGKPPAGITRDQAVALVKHVDYAQTIADLRVRFT